MSFDSFSSQIISHSSYPFIRGGWILSQLSTSDESLLQICDVIHFPGHWAVLINKRKTLCIFDHCIQSFTIDNQKQQHFIQLIKNKKINKQPELAGDTPIFILSCNDDEYFLNIHFSEINGQLRIFALLNSGILYCWQWFKGFERLIYKWKWVQSSCIKDGSYSSICNSIFTSSGYIIWSEIDAISNDKDINNEITLKRLANSKIKYKYRICYQYLNFKNTSLRRTGNEFIVSETYSHHIKSEDTIINGFDNLKDFIVTEKGIWVLCDSKFGFWSFGTSDEFIFYNWNENHEKYIKNKPENIQMIIKHQNTEDIILIEGTKRILICLYDNIEKQIICKDLCTLQLPNNININQCSIIAFKHHFYVFNESCIYIFDIKSGIIIENQSLPYDFIHNPIQPLNKYNFGLNENDNEYSDIWISKYKIGFWKPLSGIYEIIPPSVTSQLDKLSTIINDKKLSNNIFPVNYPGIISKHWGNHRLSAKYSFFELLQNTKDIDTDNIININELVDIQQKICEHLLHHVQNPSIALLLLRDKSHKPYLRNVVSSFLDIYLKNNKNQDSKISERESFHYHTPLNSTMISLLDHYNELSKKQQSIIIETFEDEDNNNEQENIKYNENKWVSQWLQSGEKIITASRDTFELITYRYPKQVLKLLENYLGLTNIWKVFKKPESPEQTSFEFPILLPGNHILIEQPEELVSDMLVAGERTKDHPLFINLCRLYYKLNPSLFIPFILLVQESAEAVNHKGLNQRNFIDRAVSTIPPELHIPLSEFKHQQIIIGAIVLCIGGKGQRAIWYLLDKNMWDYIFIIMNKYKNETNQLHKSFSPQIELFHILLAWCIHNNDIKHIEQLWEFIPDSFGVLNLLRVIKQNQVIEKPILGSLESSPPSILTNPKNDLTVGVFRDQIIQLFNSKQENQS